MNKQLNFDAPLNSLSLGNVSFNFMRELHKKGVDVNLFPVGDKAELAAYDKKSDELVEYIKKSGQSRYSNLNPNTPTLRVWHINGSERWIGKEQYLYTFYELDSPTEAEINIVKAQKHVFFSSSDACDAFKSAGCDNVSHVPLGFDPDFCKTDKEYMDDVTHFGLVGKFERRKNTSLIIQSWLKRFGNKPKYQLTCLVNNPFFSKETMDEMLQYSLMNQSWSNINFLPHLTTNSEVNELTNSIDIDLSGLSNGEGWNLPAFNATALGKWSIVSNCSSHKDWAKKDNCILVEPEHKQPCYDNIFFHEGLLFNQGSYYKISEEKIFSAFETAVVMAKQPNKEGEKLKSEFTYEKSIDKILSVIFQ
jgi:hypothetical protein